MKALVIEAPYQAVIKEVPYPAPGDGEVTIEVRNVGICGTDIHIYRGEFISPYPIVPGHEFSGVVHAIGEGVTGLREGDRVSADPSLFCGQCPYCKTGKGNQCTNWGALGNTVDGSMAEYVRVPAGNVVKIPDSMSFAEAAFIEPMACVVHAMNRLGVKAGDKAILFGAGAMGQQLIQTLVHSGVSELAVVDISPGKLEMSKSRGATRCILSNESELTAEKNANPEGYDIVVDATGIPSVIQEALSFMGRGAKYLQFGVTPKDAVIELDPFQLYNKDWTLIGSMAINHTFLPAFQWIQSGRIDVGPLISREISLEDTLAYLKGPRDPDDLKVQIRVR
ncbi:zinc-dependent alcohol dehydrogenase family protein [Paenibacillus sedimenti]|uniref:Zinc-dependent alcohol dehydrogenase family protein n=1 Tax=Paenibacillus sedimenti TaxID=2770274 RepID=A0A926KJF9_9BACL|nr:zinc-dependent alcohol dehydrogenase family protein [Paenibacillus sedimenti]MBD0378872.1 zinc-dependent alcohol dehydrogenase family protein [Paenibacillus sedimenti]